MKGFRRVLSREFKRLFTSRDLLLICIAAPFVYSLMLTSVYVNQRVEKVNAGVVDNDLSKLSRSITRKLDASQNVRVKYRYQDAASARKALTAGEIDAFMYFPAGFAQDIKRGGNAWEIMTVNASNVLVANPVMQAVSDISLQASSEIFIRNLMKKGLTKEKAAAVNNPISVRVSVLFNKNLDYSLFMIPGLIFVIIQQIILVGLGYAMASEFEAGSIKELYNLSGRSTVAMILGKAVPYGLINLFMALLFIFSFCRCSASVLFIKRSSLRRSRPSSCSL